MKDAAAAAATYVALSSRVFVVDFELLPELFHEAIPVRRTDQPAHPRCHYTTTAR